MEEISDSKKSFLPDLEECSICFEPLNITKKNPLVILESCRHTYHLKCLHNWYEISKDKHCPICQTIPSAFRYEPDFQSKYSTFSNSIEKKKKSSFCCVIC